MSKRPAFMWARTISKAKWREFRIASAKGQASPPPIENTWLITGPDRIDNGTRQRLGRLLTFHGLLRDGMDRFFPDVTRERWLTDPTLQRGTIAMKVHFHPSKLRALHDDSVFLSLIPKRSAFA